MVFICLDEFAEGLQIRHDKSSYSPVFQHPPEPNRACLVGVYAFLIWNNLCDLVYRQLPKSI